MFPTMSLDPVNSVKDLFHQSASNLRSNRPSSFPQDLRPEANMILASQQSGAIASGAYAWRVCPSSPIFLPLHLVVNDLIKSSR
jgi:hypothetical protein